jgi:hypothetical protein
VWGVSMTGSCEPKSYHFSRRSSAAFAGLRINEGGPYSATQESRPVELLSIRRTRALSYEQEMDRYATEELDQTHEWLGCSERALFGSMHRPKTRVGHEVTVVRL